MMVGFAYIVIGMFDKSLYLKYIYSETIDKFFYLDVFKILFSTLCILLLVNALNLIDGLNALAIKISLIWLLYIFNFFETTNFSIIIIILSLIIMIPFNYMGKFF